MFKIECSAISSPQRLYKKDYEQTKAKVHLPPDMLDVVAARQTQNAVTEIDYRKYLHQWTCLPDLQANIHARKVNEQLSDVSTRLAFINTKPLLLDLPYNNFVCLSFLNFFFTC